MKEDDDMEISEFMKKYTAGLEDEIDRLRSLLVGIILLAAVFALVAIWLSVYIVGM